MKRHNIRVAGGKFFVNDKPFYVYSGEIHYFRLARDKWADRIRRAKEAGLNTVSTYIPWSWHEHAEGEFDFRGKTDPQRDLTGFIKTVTDMDMFLIARIGPVSNAEMLGEGIPMWFLKNYPEACAKTYNGADALHYAMVSFMHPKYQEKVAAWYKKILPIVHSNLVSKSGPVLLVQLCNEIGMLHWVMNAADYNPATTELYRGYLKDVYKNDLGKLNDKYYTNHANFDEIPQPKGDVDVEGVVRCWDWVRFYEDFFSIYYASLAKRVKDEGINAPLIANIPMFWDYNLCARANHGIMTSLQFRNFAKRVPGVIFGGAYQMRHLNYDNFHDVILMDEVMKMIGDGEAPRICVETQAGGMNDRPRIYPSDVELLLKQSIGHEMNGMNIYMFCGGVNPPGVGFRGSYHEWQSPIDSKGKKSPQLRPIEEVSRIIKTFGEYIGNTEKVYDISIGLYAPYYETAYLKGSVIDQMAQKRDKLFFDGIARLLTLAGYNYNLVDIERVKGKDLSAIPALWVFSLDYMDKDTQAKLAEYVRKGGTLIMSPMVPTKNMGLLREDHILREFGIEIVEKVKEGLIYISGKDYYIEDEVTVFESKKRRVLARTAGRRPCAILKKIKRGRLVVIGFGVMHTLDYHIDLIAHFMQLLNITPSVRVDQRDVHAVLRKDKNCGFLVLMNFNDDVRETAVTLQLPGTGKSVKIPQEGRITLHNRSAMILPVNFPLSDRARLRYTTAEIWNYAVTDKELRMTLRGAAASTGEVMLEIRQPRVVQFDNKEIPFKWKGGSLRIQLPLTGKPQNLVII